MHLFDEITKTNYRVIYTTIEYIILINMDTKFRYETITLNNNIIRDRINNKSMCIIYGQEDNRIVDVNQLQEPALSKYKRNKLIIDVINEYYAPDYTGLLSKSPKPIINELINKSGLTRKNLWRIIIKYLQSGCKEVSLLHTTPASNLKNKTTKKKRGRRSRIQENNGKNLTDEDKNNMNIYMKKYVSNKLTTIQKCYDDMINDRYTTETYQNGVCTFKELPAGQRPTIHQFKYFIQQNTTKEERLSSKMGKQQFQNQRRVLIGTALYDVTSPGDICEIDACELDISVVSSTDRNKAVGSPVVYFLIDVFSKLILSASLSFDNNSIVAMTNCLAGLVEDKEKLLQSLGISITPTPSALTLDDIMPTNIKPKILRMDHGSDFISKQSQRIAEELSINLQYVPPGTGSMKGTIERSFRAFQRDFTDLTIHAGTKDYTNGKSDHNREAKLTIDEILIIMYSFIIMHNSTQHRSTYDLPPQMIENKIGNIPAEIWRYGIKHMGNPSYITDKTQFLYSLLIPDTAKLKRNGINYKNLRFIPDKTDMNTYNTMIEIRNGSDPINIRIDPRTISKIYYTDKTGKIQTAKLLDDIIHRELSHMTWAELEEFRKAEKMLLAKKENESEITRRAHRRINKTIVQDAKIISGKGKTDNTNMKDSRTIEKNRVAKDYEFSKRFGFKLEPIPQNVIEAEKDKTNDTNIKDTQTVEKSKINRYYEFCKRFGFKPESIPQNVIEAEEAKTNDTNTEKNKISNSLATLTDIQNKSDEEKKAFAIKLNQEIIEEEEEED